ncbi:hypothetical protein ACIA98_37715 [Streptomyces sp. NPDC051366]|uniref:hypothetical protein n=1 Tax=Streptomyces sp. NPDC051366 TaxID=3365652 RepID=UPI00379C746F
MTTHTAHIDTTATERPVPRWAAVAAHAMPLVALPVCLWRLPIAFGYGMGGEGLPPSSWNIPYVVGLSTSLMVHWAFGAFRLGGAEGFPYAEGWDVLAMTVSGLFTLWGPLLLALTFAYHRRRRSR